MEAGKQVFLTYMINTSSTHGDKKSFGRRVASKLDNAPKLIAFSLLFFTLKIGAEQLATLLLRLK